MAYLIQKQIQSKLILYINRIGNKVRISVFYLKTEKFDNENEKSKFEFEFGLKIEIEIRIRTTLE